MFGEQFLNSSYSFLFSSQQVCILNQSFLLIYLSKKMFVSFRASRNTLVGWNFFSAKLSLQHLVTVNPLGSNAAILVTIALQIFLNTQTKVEINPQLFLENPFFDFLGGGGVFIPETQAQTSNLRPHMKWSGKKRLFQDQLWRCKQIFKKNHPLHKD